MSCVPAGVRLHSLLVVNYGPAFEGAQSASSYGHGATAAALRKCQSCEYCWTGATVCFLSVFQTEYKYCYDLVLHYVLHYLNQEASGH